MARRRVLPAGRCQVLRGGAAGHAVDRFHRCGHCLCIRLRPAKIAGKALKEFVDPSVRHGAFRFVIHRGSRIPIVFGHSDLIGTL